MCADILRFLQRRGVITLVTAPGDGEVTLVGDDSMGEKDPLLARLLAAATAGAPPAGPANKRKAIRRGKSRILKEGDSIGPRRFRSWPTMNIAEILHQTIAPLWPLLRPSTFAVDIGSAAWVGIAGIHGVCVSLEDSVLLHEYVRSTASEHPAWLLASRPSAGLRYVLVVDLESARRDGGFAAAVRIAVHQMAHAIRSELACSGFYPHATRLMEIDHFLQVQAKETEGTGESWRIPRPLWTQPDDLSAYGNVSCPLEDHLGNEVLLRKWAEEADHCDGSHDLLFSLLLYRLEREADDQGALARQLPLEKSVFIPSGNESTVLWKS